MAEELPVRGIGYLCMEKRRWGCPSRDMEMVVTPTHYSFAISPLRARLVSQSRARA